MKTFLGDVQQKKKTLNTEKRTIDDFRLGLTIQIIILQILTV